MALTAESHRMDEGGVRQRFRQHTLYFAAMTVLALLLGMAVPPDLISLTQEHNSMLTLHLLMELFAVIIAVLVVVVSWHAFSAHLARSANLLIFGFLVVAICDLLHALSYEGMPALLVPSSTPRAIFFWLMGRTFEVITMALLLCRVSPPFPRQFWASAGLLTAAGLFWFGSYHLEAFPMTFVKGQGVTVFKAGYEYALCLLNVVIAVLFWRQANASGEQRDYLLALSSFVMGIGEVMFTAYVQPSDFQNIYGHLFKLLAYALLYRATFVISIRAPFEMLRDSEQRLQDSEERWKFALEGSGDGVWDVNLQTGKALHSRRYQGMLGYAEGEFAGSYDEWFTHLHPDDRGYVMEALHAYLDGQAPAYAVEYRMRCQSGQYLWIGSRGMVVSRTADGKPLRMIGTHTDITERKRVEEELRQHRIHLERMVEERTAALSVAKDEAEAATRAKSEFLAHMSHEIRTPINAIVGAARLMEYERLTRRQQGYISIMRHSSQSLLALIDDILDLAKIEAGHLDFKTELFDLMQVIETVTGAATVLTQNKNITLRFELAADLPVQLIGDPLRLEQVLNNLYSNAIKFTAEGSITLAVTLTAINGKAAQLRFVLSDTGIGIAPEKIGLIFEPFSQADSFITRAHGGTGLGLAISRQLVEMMGGVIDVDSAPGQGSRFAFSARFQLPSVAAKAVAASVPAEGNTRQHQASAPLSPLAGCRVLMVEDNEFNRHVLEGILKHYGIEVDAAVDGRDGVECFRVGQPYDAILMDLHLPGMDGFSCTRAIRALPEGGQVPIIALTANVLPSTAQACRAAGMHDHLVKPVEPEVLERALIRWILKEAPDTPGKLLAAEQDASDRLPEALPGIDVLKAADWCNGSARALSGLLQRMLAHTGDDPAKLAQHLGTGAVEAAAHITHDLMAAAATVGASALGAAAKQLNQEIRGGTLDSPLAQEALKRIGDEFVLLQAALQVLQDGLTDSPS